MKYDEKSNKCNYLSNCVLRVGDSSHWKPSSKNYYFKAVEGGGWSTSHLARVRGHSCCAPSLSRAGARGRTSTRAGKGEAKRRRPERPASKQSRARARADLELQCHKTKPFVWPRALLGHFRMSMRWCRRALALVRRIRVPVSSRLRRPPPPPPPRLKGRVFQLESTCLYSMYEYWFAQTTETFVGRYPVLFCTVVHARCGRLILRTVKYCR